MKQELLPEDNLPPVPEHLFQRNKVSDPLPYLSTDEDTGSNDSDDTDSSNAEKIVETTVPAANSSDTEIYDAEEFNKADVMAATSSACTAADDNATGHS